MTRLPHLLAPGLLLLCAALPVAAADLAAVVGWAQRVELGTLVSGVIRDVHVRPGQAVGKGDALVALDDRGFSSELARREAEFRHAQALLAEAQREDERAVELYDRTVLSDFERNQAAIALQAARAAAERARAGLVAARLDLERSVVRAPFDGVVLAVNAAPGQSLVSELQSQPLVTLADTRHLRARAAVDAARARALQPGQSLNASRDGEPVQAAVAYVGYEPLAGDGGGPRYELVADIVVDGQAPLRVGETVTLHLE